MPRIYRAMMVDGGKPRIGSSATTLGVRLPPSLHYDMTVEADGTVRPGNGGMSVAPGWRVLPPYRIPKRLKHLAPGACGNDQLACWGMGVGPFQQVPVAPRLNLLPDSSQHGVVEPAAIMPVDEYRASLEATQDQWVIDE
jgi:hypothetical protein